MQDCLHAGLSPAHVSVPSAHVRAVCKTPIRAVDGSSRSRRYVVAYSEYNRSSRAWMDARVHVCACVLANVCVHARVCARTRLCASCSPTTISNVPFSLKLRV